MERGRSRSTLVARAYLEYHVVLAELLHELLAVAHVPAQICEVGGKKVSALLPASNGATDRGC